MTQYSIELRTRTRAIKNIKKYEFLSFAKKYKKHYWIKD